MPPEHFVCENCGKAVSPAAPGTRHRNHCPYCLWSRHVADSRRQDDRDSACLGGMEPIAVSARGDGEWSVIHRCRACGEIKSNRVAGDDDATQLLCLALKPLTRPPFPMEQVQYEALARHQGTGDREGA